jgi:hypothetical protein
MNKKLYFFNRKNTHLPLLLLPSPSSLSFFIETMGFFSFIEDAWDTVKDGARKIGNAVKEGFKWAGDKAESVYKTGKEIVSNVYNDAKKGLENVMNRGFDLGDKLISNPFIWLAVAIGGVTALSIINKKS